jgi:hypothetical protein
MLSGIFPHAAAAEQAAALLKQFSVGSDAEPWLRDRPEFKGYEFSGPLRPAKMTPQRKVRSFVAHRASTCS